jgi:hypothetical protein
VALDQNRAARTHILSFVKNRRSIPSGSSDATTSTKPESSGQLRPQMGSNMATTGRDQCCLGNVAKGSQKKAPALNGAWHIGPSGRMPRATSHQTTPSPFVKSSEFDPLPNCRQQRPRRSRPNKIIGLVTSPSATAAEIPDTTGRNFPTAPVLTATTVDDEEPQLINQEIDTRRGRDR